MSMPFSPLLGVLALALPFAAFGAARAEPSSPRAAQAAAFDALIEDVGAHGKDMAADEQAYRIAHARLQALLPASDPVRRARLEAFDCQHFPQGPAAAVEQARRGARGAIARTHVQVRLEYLLCETYALYNDGQRPAYLRPATTILALTDAHRFPRLRAAALRMRAFAERDAGHYAQSLRTLQELRALDARRDGGWVALLTLIGIADAYLDMGLPDLSQQVVAEVLQRARQGDGGYMQALAVEREGAIAEQRGDLPAALAAYLRAAELHGRHPQEGSQASLLLRAARVNALLGNLPQARAQRQQAEAQLVAMGATRLMRARRDYVDALIAERSGDARAALALVERAEQGYRANGDLRSLSDVLDLKATALRALGAWRQALDAREAQMRVQQELDTRMQREQSQFLIAESESRERDLAALQLAQKAETQRNRLQAMEREATLRRVLLGAALLLLVVLGGVLFLTLGRLRGARREVRIDSLTGVASRRQVLAELDTALTVLPRGGRMPLSVLALDVDHFKRINDEHGHAAGDQVLRLVATTLRQRLRRNDSFGRTGGEEFLALLPGATCAEASQLAGQLREVLERQAFDAIVPGLRLTVSIGVAEAGAGESSQALLARADAALYRAKHGGRNRVELAADATAARPHAEGGWRSP